MKLKQPTAIVRRNAWILVLAVTLAVVGLCAADEEPEPTPTPEATPAPGESESLSEVAKGIHLRVEDGESEGEGGVVITNENIGDYASKSLLTERKSPLPGADAGGGNTSAEAGGPGQQRSPEETKKQYWRDKYTDQKKLIESIEEEIEALDSEIPTLWSQFYSWDDPAYRDGVIKPNLDRAVARREALGKRLETERDALPEILEQARKDGAKPGWFRGLT